MDFLDPSSSCAQLCSDTNVPIELHQNTQLGRHICAGEVFRAQQIVLEEIPLMISPYFTKLDFVSSEEYGQNAEETGYTCLTCFKSCYSNCSKCQWPICNQICEKGQLHIENECEILAKNNVEFNGLMHDYAGIKVLRCLLLEVKDQEKWNKFLQHDSQLINRTNDKSNLEVSEYVRAFIKDKCKLNIGPSWIDKILGICSTNEFLLTLGDFTRRCYLIFHNISYLTHSCEPNLGSIWKFHPTSDSSYSLNYFSLKFYSLRNISKGEVLTHSYIPETYSVDVRQYLLSTNYYFKCNCKKCTREIQLRNISKNIAQNFKNKKRK